MLLFSFCAKDTPCVIPLALVFLVVLVFVLWIRALILFSAERCPAIIQTNQLCICNFSCLCIFSFILLIVQEVSPMLSCYLPDKPILDEFSHAFFQTGSSVCSHKSLVTSFFVANLYHLSEPFFICLIFVMYLFHICFVFVSYLFCICFIFVSCFFHLFFIFVPA